MEVARNIESVSRKPNTPLLQIQQTPGKQEEKNIITIDRPGGKCFSCVFPWGAWTYGEEDDDDDDDDDDDVVVLQAPCGPTGQV